MNTKIVDGFEIRNKIDVDFSGVGSKTMYAYIPEEELWIDTVLSAEKEFYEKLHALEKQLLEKGIPYSEARKKVCDEFLQPKPHNLEVEIYSFPVDTGLRCSVVDGTIVRKYFDPKFIQGGHHLVYSYMPAHHIWIEEAFKKEWDFIIAHEKYEQNVMLAGLNYDYAHDLACAVEKQERRRQAVAKYLKG